MINDDKDFKDIYGNFCRLESMRYLNHVHVFDSNTLIISHIIQKLEEYLIKHLTKGCDFIKETFGIDPSIGGVDIIPQDTIDKCRKYMLSLKNGQKTFESSMSQPGVVIIV